MDGMILRYPGGKSRKSVSQWILQHLPSDTREYREPMAGGCGVFWQVEPTLKRWINDLHPGLIALYRALRDRSADFIAKVRAISPDQLAETFADLKLNDDADQALRYFVVNRLAYAGRVNYAIPSRLYYSHPPGWRIVNTDKLERAAERLQGVKITEQDYSASLKAPGDNVWVYLDPPYVKNTDLHPTSRLYQHNFELEDHVRLFRAVDECQHRVALSYDDHPLIRGLYGKKYRIVEWGWKYCGTAQAEKRHGAELLILNY